MPQLTAKVFRTYNASITLDTLVCLLNIYFKEDNLFNCLSIYMKSFQLPFSLYVYIYFAFSWWILMGKQYRKNLQHISGLIRRFLLFSYFYLCESKLIDFIY